MRTVCDYDYFRSYPGHYRPSDPKFYFNWKCKKRFRVPTTKRDLYNSLFLMIFFAHKKYKILKIFLGIIIT